MSRTIMIFFGPAGSGKGTQAEMLGKFLHVPPISTGELLRQEVRANTPLGKHAKKLMVQGKLVGIDLMDKLIKKRLAKKDVTKGFILDGYPRTLEQLKHIFKIFKASDKLYFVIIEMTDKEILKRLTGRRACSCGAIYHLIYKKPKKKDICDKCGKKLFQRLDDKPSVIKKRLQDYKKRTKLMFKPASKRGELMKVDGSKTIPLIHKEIIKKLKALKAL